MKSQRVKAVGGYLNNQYNRLLLKILVVLGLLIMMNIGFAEGTDLLDGTGNDLVATVEGGRFKMYLYLLEGIMAIAAFIKTKNLLYLCGILVVAFFFNLILHVAGIGA